MKFKYYGGQAITDEEVLNYISTPSKGRDENEKLDNLIAIDANSNSFSFTIADQIGDDGGEGAVYNTSIDNIVAKIYHKENRCHLRESKIDLMINNPIDSEKVCWPVAKIINQNDNSFVGYLMRKIPSNYKIINFMSAPKDYWDNYFSNNKLNIISLLINVAEALQILHDHNVVFGDFNFENILVNPENCDVIFIDLDGAQVDKYSSSLCKEYFNAPEAYQYCLDNYQSQEDIWEKSEEEIAIYYYNNVYSTFARDNYSLASYFFMCLMGKQPFLRPQASIVNDFFFPVNNENEFGKVSQKYEIKINDIFKIRWSFIPKFIRQFLYDSLIGDPDQRPEPKEWIKILKMYQKYLNVVEKDPRSKLLYFDNDITYEKALFDILQEFNIKDNFTYTDFTISRLLSRFVKEGKFYEFDVDFLNKHIKNISENLKCNTELTIKNIKFNLLYNIGILKKVKISLLS